MTMETIPVLRTCLGPRRFATLRVGISGLIKDQPVHVTIRVRKEIPKLRNGRFFRAFRATLAECCVRSGFRVVHYSVQQDHAHLIIEAVDKERLANGMKRLGARFARAVNRVFKRSGPVLDGRFHHRALTTPTEVRNALAYVLLNSRKHWVQEKQSPPDEVKIDKASSGIWFDGWQDYAPDPPDRVREVALPNTWFLRTGWRLNPLIRLSEIPGHKRRAKKGSGSISAMLLLCPDAHASTSMAFSCTSCSAATTVAPASSSSEIITPTAVGWARRCNANAVRCTRTC